LINTKVEAWIADQEVPKVKNINKINKNEEVPGIKVLKQYNHLKNQYFSDFTAQKLLGH